MSSEGAADTSSQTRLDRNNPFLGLEAFGEGDAAWFHGRDADEEALAQLLRRNGPAVVYGASGLGKTSLLRAGLFPRLREMGMFPIYVRVVHQDGVRSPLGQIRDRIASELDAHRVDAEPPGEGTTLWEYFHQTPLWDARNRLLTPVLVFDQFEELFTLGRRAPGREALLTELTDLIENHIPRSVRARVEAGEATLPASYERPKAKVVLSLREDYLPHLAGLHARMPSLRQNQYRLLPLTGSGALEAVLQPGADIIAPAVATDIVRFVASAGVHANDDAPNGSELSELRVEPSLLSLVCRELNLRRQRLGAAKISAELLAGSRETILRDFYERVTAELGPEVRAFIEDRLLTAGGYRTTIALQDALAQPGVDEEVIAALVDGRLVRREERLGIPHIELVHDVMARFVQESRDRRRDEAGKLAEEQARWRRFKGYASTAVTVLTILLGVAGYWAWRNGVEAADNFQELTEQAKRGEQARAQAQTRAMEKLVTTLATLAGGDLARGERSAAVARLALARDVGGDASIQPQVRTWVEARVFGPLQDLLRADSSLQGRVASVVISPDGQDAVLLGADGSARVCSAGEEGLGEGTQFFALPVETEDEEAPQRPRAPASDEVLEAPAQAHLVKAAWSGDARRIVVADDLGRIDRRSLARPEGGAGEARWVLGSSGAVWADVEPPEVEQLVSDGTGDTVAVRAPNSRGAVVTVLRAGAHEGGPAEVLRAPSPMGDVAELALDDAGRWLAIASRKQKALLLWDLAEPARDAAWRLDAEPSSLVMSADGTKVLVGDMRGRLFLVRSGERGGPVRLDPTWDSPILGLAADPSLERALVRPQSGPVVLLAAPPGEGAAWPVVSRFVGHRGKVRSARLGGPARSLVITSSSADGTVRVWEAASGALIEQHAHEGSDVLSWLMRDGRLALSLADDGALRVWDRDSGLAAAEGRQLSSGAATPSAIPDGAELGTHPGAGEHAPVFAPGDDALLTWSSDRKVMVWRRTGPAWHRVGCANVRLAGDEPTLAFAADGKAVEITTRAGSRCRWKAPLEPASGPADCSTSVECGPPEGAARAQRGRPHGAAAAPAPEERSAEPPPALRRLRARGDGSVALLGPDGETELVLVGHSGEVGSLALSPDGRLALSAASDGTVRVWDISRGRALAVWGGASRGPTSAAWSPSGRAIAWVGPDGKLSIVATPPLDETTPPTAPHRACVLGHTARVTALAFSPARRSLASGGADGCIILQPVEQDGLPTTMALAEPVRGLRFFDRELLLSSGPTPRIWNAVSGRLVGALPAADGGPVRFARVDPSGSRVLTVDARGGVTEWSVAARGAGTVSAAASWRLPFAGRVGSVTAVAASTVGARYAIGDEAGGVRVGGADDEAVPTLLPQPEGPVRALDFDHAGRLLLVVTPSRVRLHDLAREGAADPLELPLEGARAVDLAPAGDQLIAAFDDGRVEIWALGLTPHRLYARPLEAEEVSFAAESGGRALAWSPHSAGAFLITPGPDPAGYATYELALPDRLLAAAVTRDGRSVATSAVRTVAIWSGDDLSQPLLASELEGPRFAQTLGFSRDGALLLAGFGTPPGGENALAAFEASGLGEVGAPDSAEAWLIRVAADGERAAALGGQLVTTWAPGSHEVQRTLSHRGELPVEVAFGPGPERMLTLTESGTARVWRVGDEGAEGAEGTLERALWPITMLEALWTPDGARVVTASRDGRLELWAAGDLRAPVDTAALGGGFRVSATAASPAADAVALGTTAGEVIRWRISAAPEAAEQAALRKFAPPHGRPVAAVAVGRDRVASASADGDLRLWTSDGTLLAQHGLQGERVTALAFLDAEGLLLVSTDTGFVRGYTARAGAPLFAIDTGLAPVGALAVDPGARWLVSASGPGGVRAWPMALPRGEVARLLELLAPRRAAASDAE